MNVLIIRFSSLGDIVMTTAVMDALRRALPDARLSLLTRREYAGLFAADNRIEVIAVRGTESPSYIAGLVPDDIDTVVDLHGSLRSRAVTALVRKPRILRLRKHALGRRVMVWSRGMVRRRYDVLGSYLDTVRPLGVNGRVFPRLIADPSAHAEMGERLGEGGRGFIGFAPGARHDAKRWNEASYAQLADACAEAGFTPVFLGSGNDLPVIGRITGMMAHPAAELAGQTDVRATVAAISLMDGLVTNDSGPMHIAGALGVPFAAVFGPTHPDLGFAPGYPFGRILHSGVACSPCSIHGERRCRLGRRICMDRIDWEMVHDALFDAIRERGGGRPAE